MDGTKLTTKQKGSPLNRIASGFRGVARLRRPASDTCPEFDLAYVRTGVPTRNPVVIIPGGPGLASILPYKALRRQARVDGLDVIMIEHRGIGFSRFDLAGNDLPLSAMTVGAVLSDVVAVLDREGVDRAFLAGSSYGSYLASSFGAAHPDRVSGMLLDSALQSTKDLEIERRVIRELFWDEETSLTNHIRTLVERGDNQRMLLDVIRAGYELSGPDLVRTMVARRVDGKFSAAWNALVSYATRDVSIVGIPGYYEFARAGAIGFRQLNYAPIPDGLPLDPALTYSELADQFPPFEGEPFDLPEKAKSFNWPLVLLAGTRDIRTPRQIAERTADLAPDSYLVVLDNGHSALDTHPLAFEKALKLLVLGNPERIPSLASELDALPRKGVGAQFQSLLDFLNRIESR